MKVLCVLTIVSMASASPPEVDDVLTNVDVQLIQAKLTVETKPVAEAKPADEAARSIFLQAFIVSGAAGSVDGNVADLNGAWFEKGVRNGKILYRNDNGGVIKWVEDDNDWAFNNLGNAGVGKWTAVIYGHDRYYVEEDSPMPPSHGWQVRAQKASATITLSYPQATTSTTTMVCVDQEQFKVRYSEGCPSPRRKTLANGNSLADLCWKEIGKIGLSFVSDPQRSVNPGFEFQYKDHKYKIAGRYHQDYSGNNFYFVDCSQATTCERLLNDLEFIGKDDKAKEATKLFDSMVYGDKTVCETDYSIWDDGTQTRTYVYGDKGKKKCPTGSTYITTEAECESASTAIGVGFNPSSYKADRNERLPDCWLGTAGNANFNVNGDSGNKKNKASQLLCVVGA